MVRNLEKQENLCPKPSLRAPIGPSSQEDPCHPRSSPGTRRPGFLLISGQSLGKVGQRGLAERVQALGASKGARERQSPHSAPLLVHSANIIGHRLCAGH